MTALFHFTSLPFLKRLCNRFKFVHLLALVVMGVDLFGGKNVGVPKSLLDVSMATPSCLRRAAQEWQRSWKRMRLGPFFSRVLLTEDETQFGLTNFHPSFSSWLSFIPSVLGSPSSRTLCSYFMPVPPGFHVVIAVPPYS